MLGEPFGRNDVGGSATYEPCWHMIAPWLQRPPTVEPSMIPLLTCTFVLDLFSGQASVARGFQVPLSGEWVLGRFAVVCLDAADGLLRNT